MRILVYGINYSPELVGIGKFTGEMSTWLVSQGHDIRVVTAPPYYPAWKIGVGYSAWKYRRETDSQPIVYRCPVWIPGKQSGVRRVLHLLSFALSSLPVLLWKCITWRPDAVVVLAPALVCAPGGWLGAKLAAAQAWLHVQDLEVDAAFELGLLSPGRASRFVFWLERLLLKRFDCVSSISKRMLERLHQKGISYERLSLFPNWTDTDAIRPGVDSAFIRDEMGIPKNTVVAMYSGNMGEKQGLEIVIEAAKRLRTRSDILFLMCGDGASRKTLEELSAGLTNVKFIPLQPLERLNAFLNMANIHLLPQKSDAADLVMPSKLSGILACGGAVIATAVDGTELARAVTDAGGILCPPGNVDVIVEQIQILADKPEVRAVMGQRARDYAITNLQKSSILGKFEMALCRQSKASQHVSPVWPH